MKLVSKKQYVTLVPENDQDCFNLGRLAMRVANSLTVSNPDTESEITGMQVLSKDLLKLVFKEGV